MRRLFSCMLVLCVFTLTACTHIQSVNLFHFTDNLNSSYGYERVKMSDYLIKDGEYTLFFKEADTEFLLTLHENDGGKIKKIRFTISKTDDTGKFKAVNDEEAALFYKSAVHILSAYSLCEYGECEDILQRLLPQSGRDYSKTGELTAQWNNFSLVFYSNELCCQLLASDNHLEAPEQTSKPVSRPVYGQTANIRQD